MLSEAKINVPRGEYPRPQFQRTDWLCLNGRWEFEIDEANQGLEKGFSNRSLREEIVVPFCPESKLSGIGRTDQMVTVWYRREVEIPSEWGGRDVLLHFQAVDYDATVWVNGKKVGSHRGGFTPFSCDLSGVAAPGEKAVIVVRAHDDHRQSKPQGKQVSEGENFGCFYTRTTGIWQSVWMEPVGKSRIDRPRITPDVVNACFYLDIPVTRMQEGTLRATLFNEDGRTISESVGNIGGSAVNLTLAVPHKDIKLWQIGDGHLYDIKLELFDSRERLVDFAMTYAGLRSIVIDGKDVLINGKSEFQRLVLDQGYYPDGIMTASSDEALVQDIELAMAAGFNGARLHQKVFEERFLYHADRLGYIVWGEFVDWYGSTKDFQKMPTEKQSEFIGQWLEVLNRDYSHPSIVGWCPLNETHGKLASPNEIDELTVAVFNITRNFDKTRPVIDTSGYSHRVQSDIYDVHDYSQDPAVLAQRYAELAQNRPWINNDERIESVPYAGQPFFVSEFGGIFWSEDNNGWGYGDAPKTIEEFYERFAGMCRVLGGNPDMFGYCYTQLTDIFQETNGIYTFDRKAKFDVEIINKSQLDVKRPDDKAVERMRHNGIELRVPAMESPSKKSKMEAVP